MGQHKSYSSSAQIQIQIQIIVSTAAHLGGR